MNRTLGDFLADQLPVIDQILADQSRAVAQRPFEAACMFVSECIVEIEGGNRDEFLEQRWFGDVLRSVQAWYVERYGSENMRQDDHSAAGLVALFGTPFLLSPARHWADDFLPFWQTLRSVHQDTQGQIGFVLAGVNPHIVEADRVGKFDNPIFSTTRAFFLAPFDLPTTRDMVRRIARFMGLRVEEPLFRLLFEEYGGHPFLVRQACSQLARHVQTRPGELTAGLFQTERASIGLTLERNVRQILNVLAIWYPYEYEMVRLLAQGDRGSFIEFALGSAEFTQHVEGYGLVRDARTDPRISLGLVRSHLARQPRRVEESDPADQEALAVEFSRRRNRIERAMRRFLREGLLFAYGKKAMNEAMAAISEERRAVLTQFGYDQMWNELYFNELTSILDRHFSAFQRRLGIEKASVRQWMEHVNRCRSDAHARRLGSDDIAYLRVCFKRLEEILELQ